MQIGFEQFWDSLGYYRRYESSWSRSSNFCFYEEGMFSVCMLAQKESKEKRYSWGLFQWQSFTLAGVYVYAHMWLHHPHSGKNIEPEVRRHACKLLLFFGSVFPFAKWGVGRNQCIFQILIFVECCLLHFFPDAMKTNQRKRLTTSKVSRESHHTIQGWAYCLAWCGFMI